MSTRGAAIDLTGKIAVVAGGGGVLGSAIAEGLAWAGAHCVVSDVSAKQSETVAARLVEICGRGKGCELNVMTPGATEAFCDAVYDEFGTVDVLVNCVGGNLKEATTSADMSFFDMPLDAIRKVIELNFTSSIVRTSQVFGRRMKDNTNGGSIVNISSMAAQRPLTRIIGYSAAKAAIDNFTKWFAVYLAKDCGSKLRVNAIAPGFFKTEQNRYLLFDENGALTERGKLIIDHTPMGDFGVPEDLISVAVWLSSDAARFVTGIVVPIDGGFSAFAGV